MKFGRVVSEICTLAGQTNILITILCTSLPGGGGRSNLVIVDIRLTVVLSYKIHRINICRVNSISRIQRPLDTCFRYLYVT